MATAKRGLGKGLGALIEDAVTQPQVQAQDEGNVSEVDIMLLDNDKDQPRKHFNEEKLKELAQSISVHGIMQPILVYEKKGRYTIVAGERRFRAAKIAGLNKVPVIIREFTDREVLELALIENIQREDLNPMEQAAALQQLMTQYSLKQEEVAERVGKSRPAIANLVRLLALPDKVKKLVENDKISAGHARALLPLESEKVINDAAALVVDRGLSVRQTEEFVKGLQATPAKRAPKPKKEIPVEIKVAEDELTEALETKVQIQGNLKKGKILIEYYTEEQLESLYEFLKKK